MLLLSCLLAELEVTLLLICVMLTASQPRYESTFGNIERLC